MTVLRHYTLCRFQYASSPNRQYGAHVLTSLLKSSHALFCRGLATLLATLVALHGISYRHLTDSEQAMQACDLLYIVFMDLCKLACVGTPSQSQLLQGDDLKERLPCKSMPHSVLRSAERITLALSWSLIAMREGHKSIRTRPVNGQGLVHDEGGGGGLHSWTLMARCPQRQGL